MDELLDDVMGRNDPFFEDEEPSEAGSEAGGHPPVLQALERLEGLGVSLADLLDAVLYGDESIRSHQKVLNA
ncbi:hypothetical protein FS749_009483, partial [Ceratobasidium sp. UAMH 11750]